MEVGHGETYLLVRLETTRRGDHLNARGLERIVGREQNDTIELSIGIRAIRRATLNVVLVSLAARDNTNFYSQ